MRIIIIQAEIEEAIRNHILSQIAVREDMSINIDLSATRGSDGFTATIDIVKQTSEVAAPAPTPAPPPEAAPLQIKETVTRARRSPVTAAPATEAAPAAQETATESVEEAPTSEGTTEAAPTADEAPAASGEAEAAPAPKSLFGNLKKPVNTPATEA